MNYTRLKYLAREYNGRIIVPMTIVNPAYFNEIIGKLRRDGVRLEHFVLWASKETLQMRLQKRGEEANAWCVKQIDRCMEGLSNEIFEGKIHTDVMTVEHVAEAIIAACRRSGMTF